MPGKKGHGAFTCALLRELDGEAPQLWKWKFHPDTLCDCERQCVAISIAAVKRTSEAPVVNRERLLPLLVFIVIQAVLLTDVLLHDPDVGYDARAHIDYMEALSTFKLPSSEKTYEFFSPPLPYAVPALVRATGLVSRWWAAKVGQLMNLFFSIGLCLCIVKICEVVRPDSVRLQFWSLALLAIIPVYYKSFSMLRGEPLLAFLAVVIVYRTLRAYRTVPGRRDIISLGVLLGLAILSRQWAFFIFPALMGFALLLPASNWKGRLLNLKPLLLSFAIAAAVGGWFYLSLDQRYGKMTAFNIPGADSWSLSSQNARFYFGLGLHSLFTDPIRPAFANEFVPTFYSEFWGDYECYFLVYGRDARTRRFCPGDVLWKLLMRNPPPAWLETNRFQIAPWLGRMQAAAMVPSALFVAGLALGTAALFRKGSGNSEAGLLALVTITSLLGYFGFAIHFPSPRTASTIKATYVLQVVPLLAILGAMALDSLRDRSRTAYRVVAGLLAVSALRNAPFLFTRYALVPW